MITEIWINDVLIDLYDDTKIKYTIQVNDIAEIKDRQASFTNQFSVPKTPNNVRVMSGLGIASDTSRIPYEKPNCKIKYDGFDLIVKGWAKISDTNEEYKISVYSGIINFFKSIENKTLGKDLDLSEINHEKNIYNVKSSQNNPFYRYLIADYNGKTHYGNSDSVVNIDYLIPSANVKYLWDKIHERFGFTYSGSVFETEDFKNLWITYPKGIISGDTTEIERRKGIVSSSHSSPYTEGSGYLGNELTILQGANYYFNMSFNISGSILELEYKPIKIQIWQNSRMAFEYLIYSKGSHNISNVLLNLNNGDVIQFRWEREKTGKYSISLEYDITVSILKNQIYSFNEELKDFPIKDFFKEMLNRFGLTLYPNEHKKKLKYLTLDERLNAEVKDWSDKYIKRLNESYVFKSYAQVNKFVYQYNDKESDFNDGAINISNININDSITVFQSKTYSTEKEFVKFKLGDSYINVKVFKIYDKQIEEKNGEKTIKYKGLDKRFHFVVARYEEKKFKIGSEIAKEEDTINDAYVAEFSNLDWGSIISKYYKGFNGIINDSRIHRIELNLNLSDILHIDISKLYYFSQEQQYYILNKLSFDIDKSIGEFVRINKYPEKYSQPEEPSIVFVSISWEDGTVEEKSGVDDNINIKILQIIGAEQITSYKWQMLDINWVNLNNGDTPYTAVLKNGTNKFRMMYTTSSDTFYSNILTYTKKNQDYGICKKFTFGYAGVEPGDTGIVVYKNCKGIESSIKLTYEESEGRYYTIDICAIEIVSVNQFAVDVTNYDNQENC